MRGPHPTLTRSYLAKEVRRWCRFLGGALMNGLQSGLMVALIGTSQPAGAQAEDHYQFNIPRQELTAALSAFAHETGLQIVRFSDAGESKVTANSVVGLYTPTQALDILLAGSGFHYRFVNSHTIAIVSLPPPQSGS